MSEASLASNQSNNMTLLISTAPASSGKSDQVSLELFQQYGESNVQRSVDNVAASSVSDMVNGLIDGQQMPDFMRDAAKGQVADSLSSFRSDTPADLNDQVGSVLENPSSAQGSASGGAAGSAAGGAAQNASASSQIGEMSSIMSQSMQDEMSSASSGSGTSGGAGNWLAILARSLGATSGEHLKKMVELGEQMGGLDSKENPEAFAQIQSEFQAESQIFKMFQESIGTMVKSIGEGMSTVARKQ